MLGGVGVGIVEIGGLLPGDWPWLLSRSAATAWAHVAEALRPGTSPQRVGAQAAQVLRMLLAQPPNAALVVRDRGSPVGYIVVAIVPDELTGAPTGLYYDIFVEPAYRGTGVSSRLTAAGEAYCRALGVRVIRRVVAPGNEASLRHALKDGCQVERISLIKVL